MCVRFELNSVFSSRLSIPWHARHLLTLLTVPASQSCAGGERRGLCKDGRQGFKSEGAAA
jgi:hypothetical protein